MHVPKVAEFPARNLSDPTQLQQPILIQPSLGIVVLLANPINVDIEASGHYHVQSLESGP